MSRPERFIALFLPSLIELLSAVGIVLAFSVSGNNTLVICISTAVLCIALTALYAVKLRRLPAAERINSSETGVIKQYMRGALIMSFVPTIIAAVCLSQKALDLSDGLSFLASFFMSLTVLIFPFLWYPFILPVCFLAGITTSDGNVLVVAALIFFCTILRTVIQSMCFFATNKRIDYSDLRIGGVLLTMCGTINILFWLDSLSKVKRFAKLELEKGAAAE